MRGMIFVFGSNLAGRHGKGAAKFAAENFGAQYGVGRGMTGMSYALPTKDEDLRTLPLASVDQSVSEFLDFAKSNKELVFFLTPVGCGLAGMKRRDIWRMLKSHGVPNNVVLSSTWVTP